MPSALEWALPASCVKIKTLEYYTTISIFERVGEPVKGKHTPKVPVDRDTFPPGFFTVMGAVV
jgi:hypothetical protein